VVGVHLGLVRRYRALQLAAIRAAIGHRELMPTAIIGDFNEWSAGGGTGELGAGFRVHAPGSSFPSARPLAALDRVALSAGLHLRDAGVMARSPARIASDHLPIWADIRLQSTAAPDD
jgi:endonuclease/exonuclease/phosphatase family metal-dependent hydrolase